jgi:hypothetical protein
VTGQCSTLRPRLICIGRKRKKYKWKEKHKERKMEVKRGGNELAYKQSKD